MFWIKYLDENGKVLKGLREVVTHVNNPFK